ncbi:MAG: hypothetical protein WBG02_04545 [Candidatus Acidiferrum sp.]
MIVVSNTTPLRYLIAIELESLFPRLFGKIFVPEGVHQELTHESAPMRVRQVVRSRPDWYEVREVQPTPVRPFSVMLHAGEMEAILLAEQIKPQLLWIDDQAGRTVALERKLPLSGTIGILERADRLGLVGNLPAVLVALKASGFFISNALEREILLRHRARHGAL